MWLFRGESPAEINKETKKEVLWVLAITREMEGV